MKRSILAFSVAMALGGVGMAQGALEPTNLNINPDATGGDPTILVGSLNWGNGNSLATPTVAGGNVTIPAIGDIFQTYSQGSLSAFQNEAGTGIGGLQLNGPTAATNYEWTVVGAFREQVVATSGTPPALSANFVTVAPTGLDSTNFFEIWFDDTPDANMLAGTGFNNGILILSGTIDGGGTSNFTRNAAALNPGGVGNNLDQFAGVPPTDDYPLIDSINGGGNSTVIISVLSFDPLFFTDPITQLVLNFTTEQKIAFNQTEPSALFTSAPGGGAPTQPGATVASVSTCNGCVLAFDGVQGGPNEIFQTNASTSFLAEAAVPEPATVALMGLGLIGMGLGRRWKAS